MTATEQSPPKNHRELFSTIFVLLILAFHAIYLPVHEGPDEPFHLARAAQIANTIRGNEAPANVVPGRITASIRKNPCAPDLQRAFGCEGFEGKRAAFNILTSRTTESADKSPNYQAHQPPLAYGLASLLISPSSAPEAQLLTLRIAALILVALGLTLMRTTLTPSLYSAGLALLLLPGAAESLIRVSNDVAVFVWCAGACWAMRRSPSYLSAIWVGLGPWLKLTAVPVVAFAILSLWRRKKYVHASVAAALSSLLVLVQHLRGWDWGGTLELNTSSAGEDTFFEILFGICHSGYTFIKTAAWLGGWSVFKPPHWVLIFGALVAVAWIFSTRLRLPLDKDVIPHAVGLLLAAAGFVAFAVGKRNLFNVWGAVGGWYAWGWLPWFLMILNDNAIFKIHRKLIYSSWAWIAALNLVWFWISLGLYWE